MKQLTGLAIFLFSFFIVSYSQTNTNTRSAQQKVLQAEHNLAKAVLAGDSVTIGKIYASDYTGNFEGRYENKKTVMEDISPMPDATIIDTAMEAKVYGTAAVVSGVWEMRLKNQKSFYRQFTDMLINGKEGWQIVASQQDLIPAWMVRDLADSEFVPAAMQSCATESSSKSMNADVSTFLRFKNNTPDSITVNWINYSGERDKSSYQIHHIAPGNDISLQTFMTHPFVVTGSKGKCYGIYMATSSPSIAYIKD